MFQKLFNFSILLVGLLFCLPNYGQRLPEQMQLSDDGHRLTTGGVPSENFYDESEIPIVYLQFDQNNFWQQLENNYQSKTTIVATLTYNGEVLDSIGVRYKGQTSYNQNTSDKKSMAISLDEHIAGQDIDGYNTLNLQCGWLDPSYIREVLYLNTNREHIPAAKGNFVRLFVNGEDRGIYGNVQQLNKDFLKEWFVTNDGTLWRCESTAGFGPGGPGGGGPGGGPGAMFGAGVSSINYLGTDTTEYEDAYTLKSTSSDDPWTPLMVATDVLENTPNDELAEALKGQINVDRTLWFLAHEIMFADDDGYVFKGGMDYFLYWEPETNELVPLEYDGNTCMESKNEDWDVFFRQNNTNYPLCNRLFKVPALRQRYLAHVRTMLEEQFNPNVMNAKIDAYKFLLEEEIANDPYSIYGYNAFVSGLDELKEFVQARYDFYYDNPGVSRPDLTIDEVNFLTNEVVNQTPLAGEMVTISANISGTPTIGTVRLHYATGFVGSFTTLEMTENGGSYEAQIPAQPAGTYVRYYIEAEADDGFGTLSFMPKGAEHEVYLYRVAAPPSTTVVVNELQAANTQTQPDAFAEFDDWVELYNLTNADIDLSEYYLSDDYTIPYRWQFPSGTTIDANDYLIVWIDDDGSQGPLHTTYNLSSEGEQVILSDRNFNVVDEVSYDQQEEDMSYSRMPNGVGDFIIKQPTFSAKNDDETGIAILGINKMSLYPNPTAQRLQIVLDNALLDENVRLKASTLTGQTLFETAVLDHNLSIPVGDWTAGTYVISLVSNGTTLQSAKVVVIK